MSGAAQRLPGLHRSRQAEAERSGREPGRNLPTGMPRRRAVPDLGSGPNPVRPLATDLQSREASLPSGRKVSGKCLPTLDRGNGMMRFPKIESGPKKRGEIRPSWPNHAPHRIKTLGTSQPTAFFRFFPRQIQSRHQVYKNIYSDFSHRIHVRARNSHDSQKPWQTSVCHG